MADLTSKPTNLSLVYDAEYFDASQSFLYIGDILVDEVNALQYQVQQNKTPIYGYASQLFDAVAPANVLVQGSFRINFKESGYLYLILRRYKGMGGQGPFREKNDQDYVLRQTIEDALQERDNDPKDLFEFQQSVARYATFKGNKFDRAFENMAEIFEDKIWGKTRFKNPDNAGKIETIRADDNKLDNFDIYLVFGDFNTAEANHTVRKIEGVHLIGQSQLIQVEGGPLQEEYSFIARDFK